MPPTPTLPTSRQKHFVENIVLYSQQYQYSNYMYALEARNQVIQKK